MQPAGNHVDLGQAGFGKGVDLVQAESRRNLRRLSAMFDRDIGPASRGRVQEPGPVMPSGAAARVVGLVDDAANFFERSDVLGVTSQRVFDLGLLEYGVDAAQPVRLRVGQRVEAAERVARNRSVPRCWPSGVATFLRPVSRNRPPFRPRRCGRSEAPAVLPLRRRGRGRALRARVRRRRDVRGDDARGGSHRPPPASAHGERRRRSRRRRRAHRRIRDDSARAAGFRAAPAPSIRRSAGATRIPGR